MNDLISRQAAIDAIRASTKKYTGFMEMEMYTDDDAVEAVNNLPSAQPDACDGCMWEDAFGYGECYRCKRAFSDMYMVKKGEKDDRT